MTAVFVSQPVMACQRTASFSGSGSAAMPVWAASPLKTGQSAAAATGSMINAKQTSRFIGADPLSRALDAPDSFVEIPIGTAAGQAVEEIDADAARNAGSTPER